jgi:hypothetical protein
MTIFFSDANNHYDCFQARVYNAYTLLGMAKTTGTGEMLQENANFSSFVIHVKCPLLLVVL